MGSDERQWDGGRLHLESMFSFEPFTIQALGSPQVFQTGAPALFHVFLRWRPNEMVAHMH